MSAITTKRWNDAAEDRDGTRIFVAQYRPRGLPKAAETWSERRREFAPSRALHAAWYKGQVTWDEYVAAYLAEMSRRKAELAELAGRVLGGERICLLCYCRDESRCHRTLLASLVRRVIRQAGFVMRDAVD